jgi:hypothetical protein
MFLDMLITINTKPNAYDVLYKVYDADGIELRRNAITYLATDIMSIVNDLLFEVKPTAYKVYADDMIIKKTGGVLK